LARKTSKFGVVPTAFQIRHGGDKGVLAIDPTLKGRRVVFRNSMHKFDSDHKTLDVTGISKPSK
jgi:RNA-dependent RNA polymerase